MEATEGRIRYQVRVAARALSIVQREIEAGDEPERAHAARLARLGFSSDGPLAAAIRSGSLDDRWEEVVDAVRATVAPGMRGTRRSRSPEIGLRRPRQSRTGRSRASLPVSQGRPAAASSVHFDRSSPVWPNWAGVGPN